LHVAELKFCESLWLQFWILKLLLSKDNLHLTENCCFIKTYFLLYNVNVITQLHVYSSYDAVNE